MAFGLYSSITSHKPLRNYFSLALLNEWLDNHKALSRWKSDTLNLPKTITGRTVPTWWLPHFVPVSTKPGSSISFSSLSDLYTWVPRHLSCILCVRIVVSMATALDCRGLEAELWHWIFPHLASLISKERLKWLFLACCMFCRHQLYT